MSKPNSKTTFKLGEIKLHYLKTNYVNLARQGSESWIKGRRTRFGGSEINRVIGTNKTSSKLIKDKVDQVFISNLYCWWGNTFEPIAKEYLLFKFNYIIEEFGAIPSSNFPVAYSPDGVFINPVDDDLWLLEIKCPFLRNLDEESVVPKNYISQVQMGMQILPCTKSLFSQFKFRLCKLEHINKEGKYSRAFHREQKRSKEQKEIWFGSIYWNDTHGLKYGYNDKRDPTAIYYSFKDKVVELSESYNRGTLMYFKCFYVSNITVDKDPKFYENTNTKIFEKYEELILTYKDVMKLPKNLSYTQAK